RDPWGRTAGGGGHLALVVQQPPAILAVVFQREISGIYPLDKALPLLNWPPRARSQLAGDAPGCLLPPPKSERPRIGRIAQYQVDPCVTGPLPDDRAPIFPTRDQPRQEKIVIAKVAQHGSGTAEVVELRKDRTESRLHIAMRVQRDTPIAGAYQADGEHLYEGTLARFIEAATVQAGLEGIEFGFTQSPLQPQQEPIIIPARIVDPVD